MCTSMLKIVCCSVDISVAMIRIIISQLSISFRLVRIQLCVAKSIRYMTSDEHQIHRENTVLTVDTMAFESWNADQVKTGAIGVFSSAVT